MSVLSSNSRLLIVSNVLDIKSSSGADESSSPGGEKEAREASLSSKSVGSVRLVVEQIARA